MSQKHGLAVFFGCVIAIAIAYVATYSRFHPEPAAVAAATGAPAIASAAIALTTDLAPLPAASGPLSWARLSPAQHVALAPFADQWDSFSDARKRKWLKIASRFPKMTPDAQKRLQERMTEWVKMTPDQRRVARENYQVATGLSAQARERAWKAYQQLPEEQKERLAAAERRRRPSVVSAPPSAKSDRDVRRLVNAHDHPASNPNVVPQQPASSSAGAPPAVASSTAGSAPAPATVTPVSPADAPSLFKGS